MQVLVKGEELPEYRAISSALHGHDGEELQLPEAMREHSIYLIMPNEQVILAIGEEWIGKTSNYILEIKDQLSRKSAYSLKKMIYVSHDLLELLIDQDEYNKREEAHDFTKVEQLFDNLIRVSVERGASDIHVIRYAGKAEVKIRVHGEMGLYQEWTADTADKVISVAYSVFGATKEVTWNKTVIQDTDIERVINNQKIRIRYAHKPSIEGGWHAVMRLLMVQKSSKAEHISTLGYNNAQSKMLELMRTKPSGVIVLAGTTGSGKSTTIRNMLMGLVEHYQGRVMITSVEDPPEYNIPGVVPTPVVRRRSSSHDPNYKPFADAILAAMRCDPDIIFIGEVRDPTTAEALVHAVESGHQVFTTVHAGSAVGVISRLEHLGVARETLCAPDFMAGLIYQKLVPVLCQKCSVPVSGATDITDEALRARLDPIVDWENDNIRRRHHQGCEACQKGIKGRSVCAEAVLPDNQFMHHVSKNNDLEALKHWKEIVRSDDSGAPLPFTAVEHAVIKMRQGDLDPIDLEDTFGSLELFIRQYPKEELEYLKKLFAYTPSVEEPTEISHDDAQDVESVQSESANASNAIEPSMDSSQTVADLAQDTQPATEVSTEIPAAQTSNSNDVAQDNPLPDFQTEMQSSDSIEQSSEVHSIPADAPDDLQADTAIPAEPEAHFFDNSQGVDPVTSAASIEQAADLQIPLDTPAEQTETETEPNVETQPTGLSNIEEQPVSEGFTPSIDHTQTSSLAEDASVQVDADLPSSSNVTSTVTPDAPSTEAIDEPLPNIDDVPAEDTAKSKIGLFFKGASRDAPTRNEPSLDDPFLELEEATHSGDVHSVSDTEPPGPNRSSDENFDASYNPSSDVTQNTATRH